MRLVAALVVAALFGGAPIDRPAPATAAEQEPMRWLYSQAARALEVSAAAAPDPARVGRAEEPPKPERRHHRPRHGRLWLFKGLGAWIDAYDFGLGARRTVAMLDRYGVRTLYLQTGRTNTMRPVFRRARPWLVAAQRRGMKVVGWYLPYYRAKTRERDLRRTVAIKRYRYRGHRFDGLGIDIEFHYPGWRRAAWNRRVWRHAARVRRVVGPEYPVAAIPPPPLQMRVAPGTWMGFPWRKLARSVDAMHLMSYWSGRIGCPKIRKHCAFGYTKGNVKLTRRLTGRRKMLVHVIGGVANAINRRELRNFVRGARRGGADGASIYDVGTTPRAWWRILRALRTLR